MNMKKMFGFLLFCSACSSSDVDVSKLFKKVDRYTMRSKKDVLRTHSSLNQDRTLNVVIEIPAGTVEKWEVSKQNGDLIWTYENNIPRTVKYLPYPGNYGFIPKTHLPKRMGGDGDPLDVLVIGPAVERGTIQKVKLLGVLRLLDRGEKDDKLIAVPVDSPFAKIKDLEELEEKFSGIKEIVQTWFVNYKGPEMVTSNGYGDIAEAKALLHKSMIYFEDME